MADTNRYLYMIQPTRPEMLTEGATSEESEIVSQHFNYLKNLTEQGTVILAGRTLNTDPSSFGVVIFNAESKSTTLDIMENDPAVQHSVTIKSE